MARRNSKPTEKLTDPDSLPPELESWIEKGGLLATALTVIAVFSWAYVITHTRDLPAILASPYPNLIFNLTFVLLLVALFCTLYLYTLFKKRTIRKYAKGVGYVFSAIGPPHNYRQCFWIHGRKKLHRTFWRTSKLLRHPPVCSFRILF